MGEPGGTWQRARAIREEGGGVGSEQSSTPLPQGLVPAKTIARIEQSLPALLVALMLRAALLHGLRILRALRQRLALLLEARGVAQASEHVLERFAARIGRHGSVRK